MASNRKLSCLEKRDLLNQSAVSLDLLISLGRQYEDLDLLHDAVDFLEKANARDDLEKLRQIAFEAGDVFLFKRICRLLDREITREEWLGLARKAEAMNKYRFAAEAYRSAGDENRADELLKTAGQEMPEGTAPAAEPVETA